MSVRQIKLGGLRILITYVSFDPGKRTGVTTWNEKGECIKSSIFLQPSLDVFLEALTHISTIKTFIVEEYRVYSHMAEAHIGSKIETAQVIGQIKSVARQMNVQVIEQAAIRLRIAAKWAQVKVPPKGQHIRDDVSSYLHGYYYLHKKGIIKAKVLEDES